MRKPREWRMENFTADNGPGKPVGMANIMNFVNKHGLGSDEFKIGPCDPYGIITVLYYSEEQLHK